MSFRKVEPDWTPRSLGNTYCSPACGFGCKRTDYDIVVLEAAALAERMGPEWMPRVWENLGWYYEVTKGVAVIHAHRYHGQILSYTAFFNTVPQVVAHSREPEDALASVLKQSKAMEQEITKALSVLEYDAIRLKSMGVLLP